jgi:hypothetical protein
MKYVIVGGVPYVGYTNTTTFASLKIVGKGNTIEEVKEIVDNHFDECGGLLIIIDMETGEEASI